MRKKKKEQTVDPALIEEEQKKATVADGLPFQDFEGDFVHTKDDRYLGYIQVDPVNINLKSKNEKKRIIAGVHECYNGQQEAFQVQCIQRPQDLDDYIRQLAEKQQEEQDLTFRRLQSEYIRYVNRLITSGEAMENQYYLVLSSIEKDELQKKADEMCLSLSRGGLSARKLIASEIIDFYYTYFNPTVAAFEKAQLLSGFSL